MVSACLGGHLTNYFSKVKFPGGCPGGGLIAVGFDSYIRSRNDYAAIINDPYITYVLSNCNSITSCVRASHGPGVNSHTTQSQKDI